MISGPIPSPKATAIGIFPLFILTRSPINLNSVLCYFYVEFKNFCKLMTLIKSLFTQQKRYIDFFFDHVDPMQAERFFEICLQTQGLLIFTGVGKSGIIAEKIALTLISTGTKALYLPPMNFLHGDIGIVTSNDTIVMLSKKAAAQRSCLTLSLTLKKEGPNF